MDGSTEMRIVLLGKTGNGKSSAGNVILGEDKFPVSCSASSVTQDCERGEFNYNGTQITVIDAPGIFDTDRSEKDVKYATISCLTECAPGPHAFILVLKVGRYTAEEKEAVRKVHKWFGEEALKHTVILFTHGDKLDRGMTIQQYTEDNTALQDLVNRCGGRVHVIDSKSWNKRDRPDGVQTNDLLHQICQMVTEQKTQGALDEAQILEKVTTMLTVTSTHSGQQSSMTNEASGSRGLNNSSEQNYRSNTYQVERLMSTIENMVKANKGKHYTNESLETIAQAIEEEVKKIQNEESESEGEINMSEIRRRARERVRTKTLRLLVGVGTGAVLGALLGVAVGASLPVVLVAGLLTAAVTRGYLTPMGKIGVAAVGTGVGAGAAVVASAEAGAVIGAEAVGVAGAEAGVSGAAIGAGAATGIGVGVAAGALAAVGAIGGGIKGAEAAAKSDNPEQAGKNAAAAVAGKAENMIKEAFNLAPILARKKEVEYKPLK